ncbi:MAG: hypothetical protein E6I19_08155 [Chloroflexi bacterium]|nr:MAG: hypothetical protein E6I19_08155 [Chloroflexota bacterium]
MVRQGPTQSELDRLTADLRVFDANGIERAAWGWDRHERRGLDAYHTAERAALAQIEQHDLGPRWEEFRRTLFGLTESTGALVSWKAKHGQEGHKAERAAFGAALGLFARDHLTREQYASLVEPMAEALPWLLPDRAPAPRMP